MRRTYGFKKGADQVRLSQITDGITTREGRVLDGGAGVSKGGAIRAIARLEARGILLVQRNRSGVRGNEPTTYPLRKAGTPLYTENTRLVQGVHQEGASDTPALVYPLHPQETDVQETDVADLRDRDTPARAGRFRDPWDGPGTVRPSARTAGPGPLPATRGRL